MSAPQYLISSLIGIAAPVAASSTNAGVAGAMLIHEMIPAGAIGAVRLSGGKDGVRNVIAVASLDGMRVTNAPTHSRASSRA